MKKIIYVTPHLSTGGLPKYLLEKINKFKKDFDIFVIEYNNISNSYIVHRNEIINTITSTKYFCLDEDKTTLLTLINKIKPDIVHFEEIPDTFIQVDILEKLFRLKNRPFYIVTTHSKESIPNNKVFTPDKYVLVSEWSLNQFKSNTKIPCDILKYPIIDFTIEKEKYKKELKLDANYYHVLNVGLFTEGKNQKEVFQIAKMLQDYPIKFHFIGNQAPNFKNYWEPLMYNKPNNCIVWGERDDVYKFYQACDLFYFCSTYELFPIVIREALSYKLPMFIKKLDTYLQEYDNIYNIQVIDDNIHKSKQLILDQFKL
jgi:hypothetical protein